VQLSKKSSTDHHYCFTEAVFIFPFIPNLCRFHLQEFIHNSYYQLLGAESESESEILYYRRRKSDYIIEPVSA